MPLSPTEICDRAADAILALFDTAVPPLTGIVIGAGDGELAASLLVAFPQMSFWLVDHWQNEKLEAMASGEGGIPVPMVKYANAADRIRAVESKTAFAHDRRRVVNLPSQQAERRCPFRSIDLLVINGIRSDIRNVTIDEIREQMLEQLHCWHERLIAGGKRYASVPAARGVAESEAGIAGDDSPCCVLAYVTPDGNVLTYPG